MALNPEAIEELLESSERAAKAADLARQQQRGLEHQQDFVPLEEHPEPRRYGRARDDNRERGSTRNRYSAEREENDERRSRRSRDLADDEDLRDASDKGSANGSVRSRRRSRSPEPDRHRRSREHDSYHYRDRQERIDRYEGGGRYARDDDRYRPGRDYDTRGPRDDRERSPRRRDDRDRRGGRERLRTPPKKVTPEPTDDERDRRTVFVQELAARLRSRELRQFFEQVGHVVDAQIVKDRVSGRSKG